jgi:cobyrinic acid a,c-diamide synthase
MQKLQDSAPRVVVAGLSGDSGKTVVSLGLLLLARQSGIPTAAFKKGPDYIDAAWLSWACGNAARNLDTYLMGKETAAQSFLSHALSDGLNLIEGNRGLYDGFDARGTHSTAELAKLLGAPVLLVINAAKVTHTVAALVLGCQKLDSDVRIGGVILNRVAGRRHEAILRDSVESACGIPVLGALPAVKHRTVLPGRHLGLVTPQEHGKLSKLPSKLLSWVEGRLDLGRILEVAGTAPPIKRLAPGTPKIEDGRGLKIGYVKDSAFTFYYPENLEMLEKAGAELEAISALSAQALPDNLDALYIGGGFPETHAPALSQNSSLLASIRHRAAEGLPVYAECGGLMLLSRAIRYKGRRFAMAGVLPFDVEVCAAPQGHGYIELTVDHPNPYYPVGTAIRGHEFHYSRIIPAGHLPPTACAVQRGTGSFEGREALLVEGVWASYTHVHALATPEWALGLMQAARQHSTRKSGAGQGEGQTSVEMKSPCSVR